MMWCRRDIQTAVAFLSARVKEPDEDDWNKLKRLLKYLHGMLYLPLIPEIDNLNIIKRWVDASYATHPDCKGHTGAMMSLEKGQYQVCHESKKSTRRVSRSQN